MNSQDDVDFSRPLALQYLQHIGVLTEEIRTGMDAMGSNAISVFRESVSRQQEICANLCRLSAKMSLEKAMAASDAASSSAGSGSDRALADQILRASESLQDLNRRYASLLKHSQESVRLFAGLCRSYTEHFERPAVLGASRSNWSCES